MEPPVLRLPGSKSFTNRAWVLSGLCSTPLCLTGVLESEDTNPGRDALAAWGFEIQGKEDVQIRPPQQWRPLHDPLFLNKAGTLARFLPGLALTRAPSPVTLKAHPQLQKRPIAPLLHALRQWGARIEGEDLQSPLTVFPSPLKGQCTISGEVSGQFLSALLLAGAGASQSLTILRTGDRLVQPGYVSMTVQALRAFGARIVHDESLRTFELLPSHIGVGLYHIEPDASTCCYFLAAAFLKGRPLIIDGIGKNSLQPDKGFCTFLEACGAQIIQEEHRIVLKKSTPSLLDLGSWDFTSMSDQALTAAAVAVSLGASLRVSGIGHIQHHESNRLKALETNLRSIGVPCRFFEEGFDLSSTELKGSLHWPTWDDHRFAMSGAVLSTRYPQLQIGDKSCVAKTCPHFFEIFEAVFC